MQLGRYYELNGQKSLSCLGDGKFGALQGPTVNLSCCWAPDTLGSGADPCWEKLQSNSLDQASRTLSCFQINRC
jgi:hypothetical protein